MKLINCAILVLMCCSVSPQKRINSLNVLMPIIQEPLDKRTVQYEMQAYGGCWGWDSSQPSVLRVVGIPDEKQTNCQSKAIIQLATNQLYQSIIWISVQDKYTNDRMRVEARVAKLFRIEIATKLKTIDVGALEELTLRGFDLDQNTFSSLEGMRFEWTSEQPDILDFVQLKDVEIKISGLRKELEGPNFMTDIAVARGLKTGRATIVARVKELGYESVSEQRVTINVIEQFTMIPHYPLYLLPLQELQFQLYLIKNEAKDLSLIKIPSKKYSWQTNSLNSTVEQSGLLTCGVIQETSQITVTNSQSVENYIQNSFTVVRPHRIELNIREVFEGETEYWDRDHHLNYFTQVNDTRFDNVQALIIGRQYYVHMYLYDEHRNQIFMTPSTEFLFEVDISFIKIIKSRNYQLLIEPTQVVRDTEVIAKFLKVRSGLKEWLSEVPIESRRSLEIVTPIQIIKLRDTFLLPLVVNDPQKLKLYTVGGSGSFIWSLLDDSVAAISQDGQLVAQSLGKTYVVVRDTKNLLNFDQVQIIITQVSSFEPIEARKELILNTQGQLYVRAFGSVDNKEHHFANCSNLRHTLDVTTSEQYASSSPLVENYQHLLENVSTLRNKNSFFSQLLPMSLQPYEKYAVQIKHNVASKERLLKLFSHYQNSGVCGSISIQPIRRGQVTSQLVSQGAHSKKGVQLYILNELHGSGTQPIVLAYGSSFVWSLDGGPQPWEDTIQPQIEFHATQKEHDEILKSTRIVSRDTTAYQVKCKVSEDFTLKDILYNIQFQNHASLLLPDPLKLTTKINIICAIPHKLDIQSQSSWILSPSSHEINATALDARNHLFYNYTSIELVWSIPVSHTGISLKKSEHISEILPHPLSQRIIVVGRGVHGHVVVECSAKNIINGPTFPVVQSDATFYIQQNLKIEPEFLILYKNPNNIQKLQILLGSGEFSVHLNDTQSQFVKHQYDDKTKQIILTPISQGTIDITVKDMKLVHAQPVHAKVIVSVPSKIVISSDQRLILLNQDALITVEVLDQSGLPFHGQYQFMRIDLLLEEAGGYKPPKSLTIQRLDQNNLFKVTGRQPGNQRLVAVLNNDISLLSNFLDLEVFLPLRVSITNVLLAPECYTTIELIDGPIISDINVVDFVAQSYDKSIIEVLEMNSRVYKVSALKKGTTEILFSVSTMDTIKRSLTEATAQVNIQDITSAQISSLKTVHVGATFRVIAQLFIKQNQLTFGVCSYLFKWSHKQSNVLRLHTPLAILDGSTELHSAINATALGEGISDIEVEVIQQKSRLSIKSSTSIKCIPSIFVNLPTYVNSHSTTNNVLLLPPNSEYRIRSSKKNNKFALVQDANLGTSGLQVEANGLVKTGAVRGQAFLLSLEASQPQETSFLAVQVTPVSAIFIKDSHTITSLQTEAEVVLDVLFLDSYGRLFAVGVNEPLIVRVLNNLALDVYYQDAQLHVKSKNRGDSLVIVQLKNQPDIYDLFYVQVGSLINPSSPVFVHVGGLVEFSTQTPSQGQWKSSKDSVMQVNSQTGRAQALNEGDCTIIFEDGGKHSAKVRVFKSIKILKQTITSKPLTNIRSLPQYEDEYQIDFLILAQDQQINFDTLGPITNNLQFTCESQNNEVFKVRSAIINVDGQQLGRCFIQLRQIGQSKIPQELLLTTTVSSKNQENNFKLVEKFTLPVQWGLRVDPTQKAVELTMDKRSQDIYIPSSSRLQALVDDQIKSHVKTSFSNGDTFTISFRVPDNASDQIPLEGRVRLIDPVSNQEDTIFYYYEPSKGSEGYWDHEEFRLVDALVTGIVIFITIVLMFNYFKKEIPKPQAGNWLG